MPASNIRVQSQVQVPDSLLLMQATGSSSGSSNPVFAAQPWNPEQFPAPDFNPGSTKAVVAIWKVNQQIHFIFSLKCFSENLKIHY